MPNAAHTCATRTTDQLHLVTFEVLNAIGCLDQDFFAIFEKNDEFLTSND
jgi:hypothetical protein